MTTAIFNIDKTIGVHYSSRKFLQEDATLYILGKTAIITLMAPPLFVGLMLRRINRRRNKKKQQVEEEKKRKNGTRLDARRCRERTTSWLLRH
jgi:hypothetical protein